MENPLTRLLQIRFPIVQAGMVWCSGWELASAVSRAGGLGVIGAGSMYPDVLDQHLARMRDQEITNYAVNVPLLYPNIEDHMERIIRSQVPVVITSAGNPKTWTHHLKSEGIKVLHVVSSAKFAVKAEQAGVDGIIAEGFEAGGHNGREETTTFVLLPLVRAATGLPLIAAGGIATGRGMLAAMVLGADGVQMGTRFVLSRESSAHQLFKEAVAMAGEGDTLLTLKELTPVRLLKNPFFSSVMEAYHRGAGTDELRDLLGRGRAKKGMFEGDLEEGELEIGQISALLKDIPPAADIVRSVWEEFELARERWCPGT